ncbi:aldo/keto reductase [Flexivirga meconopsidis]|uniref:aldo/keto reductase n=1 Tax=Flexivirga meconopsidis TaxID=2977121 RepID=UPI002240A7ED|nr:aldo/keto reductase [Flexivirga meconopsidis]
MSTSSHADLTSIPRRRIADLDVSAVGLGCMGMNFAYGATAADETEAIATLNDAIDLGVNFLDTADMYAAGANEQLLAKVLADRRDEVVLATKFGITIGPDGMANGTNGSASYVKESVDGSLRRLGVDTIDLYYLHRVDPQVPIEETVGAMAELVAAGKVRQLGLSEASADSLHRATAVHPIAALQSEWSIFSRDIEAEDVPAARELGIAVVPYSPLGRGMLTGSAAAATPGGDDFRSTLPRWQGDNLTANLTLVERIRQIAGELDATPGQVALAWLLAQGDDVVPIPGTKRRSYLRENAAATTLALPADVIAELSAMQATGDRYPDMSWVAGDSARA